MKTPNPNRLRARSSKAIVTDERRLTKYIAALSAARAARRARVLSLASKARYCLEQIELAERRIVEAKFALRLLIKKRGRRDRSVALEWQANREKAWSVTGAKLSGWLLLKRERGQWTQWRLRTEKEKPRPPSKRELAQLVAAEDLNQALGLREAIEGARERRALEAARLRRLARHIFGPGARPRVVLKATPEETLSRGALKAAFEMRRQTVEDLVRRIRRLLDLVERCEFQLDELMQEFNQIGPYGYRTLVVSWRVEREGGPSIAIPEGPIWGVVWRRTPNIGLRQGVRLVRRIHRPTEVEIREGQLGKYKRKLFAQRDRIERKARRRSRWLKRLSAAHRALIHVSADPDAGS